MTSTKKKRKPTSSLLARRQVAASSSLATTKPLPSKLSRKLIRSHHTAQKRLSQAIQQNDTTAITTLTSQLSSSTGNLEAYQRASVSGQSSKRGGDSSKILVDWFLQLGLPKPGHAQNPNPNHPNDRGPPSAYRLLEIGCLSPSNAIHSYFPNSYRTLLDLNSLHPEIIKQDFMTFPVPKSVDEGYDVVSCSLVLNYVPTPVGRGDMLKHISLFMEQALQKRRQRLNLGLNSSSGPQPRRDIESENTETETGRKGAKDACWDDSLPALFLVLPAPCVTNSRYLTEKKLGEIMTSLGYEVVRRKLSPKLVYYLYKYIGNGKGGAFKKVELLPGGKRNNFAIVVE
ncbi:hypothetical protein TWF694_007510 [Orbilia ellipsospora]|uniref:25S rRNA adenine-N(1) methyltransferase n=1 Tax=Orbilia ellipsospora TaxID=2528407 RepID=A0AAV9XLB4_9PEZI